MPVPHRRNLRVRAHLLLLVAALGPLLASTPAAVASAEATDDARTTWSIQPASADGPDGRVSLRHEIEPDGEVTDYVTITNSSGQAAAFDVYPSDGVVTADGQFDLLPAGSAPTDSGSWIALGDSLGGSGEPGAAQRIQIDAESAVTLPLTIRVPADATPGDHPAGIVATLVQESSEGVVFDTRVGARLHLRVAGDIVAKLSVRDVTTSYVPSWNPFAPGTLRVDYVIANSGNVRLGADVRIAGSGPFGLAEYGDLGPTVREILPGQHSSGSVDIVGVWPMGLLENSLTATPLFVGEDDQTAKLHEAETAQSIWAMPWVQLGMLVLLVALIFLMRMLHRRREARVEARIEAALVKRVVVAQNEG